jgi:LacI family transcriptional regulator
MTTTAAGHDAPPRVHDVARVAGVSLSTVSNVFNHPQRVAVSTRERVEAAVAELGFIRNQNARALVVGATHTIGLVVFDLRNSLFVDIASGAQRAARARQYGLQLGSSESDIEQEAEHLQFFDSARVSGVLLAPMYEAAESVARLRRHGHPVVIVNHEPSLTDACCVLVDNREAGRLAAEHLIDTGARRVAVVVGRRDYQPVSHRLEGVQRAVMEASVAVEIVEFEIDSLEVEDGVAAGDRIARMPANERPDAVLAVTDLLAMAIVNRLTAQSIRVPEDILVMGCDHNTAAWGGAIPLSSVSLQGELMGEHAVELLIDEIERPHDHVHRTITIVPSLMIRESTVGRGPSSVETP